MSLLVALPSEFGLAWQSHAKPFTPLNNTKIVRVARKSFGGCTFLGNGIRGGVRTLIYRYSHHLDFQFQAAPTTPLLSHSLQHIGVQGHIQGAVRGWGLGSTVEGLGSLSLGV
jgi:hypothetical protein